MIRLSERILLHDWVRSLISISGVAFAVTLILAQVGFLAGMLENSVVTIKKLNADIWITAKNTPNVDFAHVFPEDSIQLARNVPGVERADGLIVTFMQIGLKNGSLEWVIVYGLDDFGYWGIPWRVVAGNTADLKRSNSFFLDRSAYRRFGSLDLGEYREIQGRRLRLIGFTDGALSFTTTPLVFMDIQEVRALMPEFLTSATSYVLVKISRPEYAESVVRQLREKLPNNDVHTKEHWVQLTRDYWLTHTGLGIHLAFMVAVGCVIGVLTVGQTLYALTLEHAKEFATARALGETSLGLFGVVLQVSILVGICGFILGSLSYFAIRLAASRFGVELILSIPQGVTVFMGTIACCSLGAVVSFFRLRSIDPMLAFQTR